MAVEEAVAAVAGAGPNTTDYLLVPPVDEPGDANAALSAALCVLLSVFLERSGGCGGGRLGGGEVLWYVLRAVLRNHNACNRFALGNS